jgi:hypothetical protein
LSFESTKLFPRLLDLRSDWRIGVEGTPCRDRFRRLELFDLEQDLRVRKPHSVIGTPSGACNLRLVVELIELMTMQVGFK